MSIKINPVLIIVSMVGVALLIFMLFRGCSNAKYAIKETNEFKTKNDSLIAKTKRDSIEFAVNKRDYEAALEVANGQLEIKDNQLERIDNELDVANIRISLLLAKHKEIEPNTDTSHTYVPNEFIVDCNGCFTELSNGQRLVQQYRADNEQLKLSLRIKEKLQTDRIAQQDQEKAKLDQSLQDSKGISNDAVNASVAKGQLYFSWGVLWSPFPKMAGVGLMYQTKYRVQYGVKGYWGTYGTMVETQMNLPLSLRRRK